MEQREQQYMVARIALQAISDAGFALAGSGAIREHGVIDRPTQDVDLFTPRVDAAAFDTAAEQVEAAWRDAGLDVVSRPRASRYAQFLVSPGDGSWTEVDLAVDWRAKDPVRLEVGPVLDLQDAISNKVSALYGRGAARDFLDVDAIRRSGRYSDEQLLRLSEERDPGFDRELFAQQLQQVARVEPDEVKVYGVAAQQWSTVQERTLGWSQVILEPASPEHGARGGRSAGQGPVSGQAGPGIEEILAMPPAGPYGPTL